MSRPLFIIAIAVTAICAFGLFQVKNNVKNLKKDLVELQRQISSDKESIHVLRAEWAFLNQPERIRELSQRYLGAQYIKYSQLKGSDQISQILSAGNVAGISQDIVPTFKPTL